MADVRIAVVGAGMAGLACANELVRADAKVTVFERSRGLGGRLATRRQGDLAFDHGAQFITARSRPFLHYAEIAARAGGLAAWQPRIMEDARIWEAPIGDWWVGTPGMSALVRPLARNLDIRGGVTVQEMHPGQRGWECSPTPDDRTSSSMRSRSLYRRPRRRPCSAATAAPSATLPTCA